MSSALRTNRKATDEELLVFNNLGLSLQTVAKQFDMHPTTVTQRLKGLGISVADTRRSFMEDIYNELSPVQKEFLIKTLGTSVTVKEYVKKLIVQDCIRSV